MAGRISSAAPFAPAEKKARLTDRSPCRVFFAGKGKRKEVQGSEGKK